MGISGQEVICVLFLIICIFFWRGYLCFFAVTCVFFPKFVGTSDLPRFWVAHWVGSLRRNLCAICVCVSPVCWDVRPAPRLGSNIGGAAFLNQKPPLPPWQKGRLDLSRNSPPCLASAVHLSKDIIGALQAWKAGRSLNPKHPKKKKT